MTKTTLVTVCHDYDALSAWLPVAARTNALIVAGSVDPGHLARWVQVPADADDDVALEAAMRLVETDEVEVVDLAPQPAPVKVKK